MLILTMLKVSCWCCLWSTCFFAMVASSLLFRDLNLYLDFGENFAWKVKGSTCLLPTFSLKFFALQRNPLEIRRLIRLSVAHSDSDIQLLVSNWPFRIMSCIYPSKSVEAYGQQSQTSLGFILSSKVWPEARESSCLSGKSDTVQMHGFLCWYCNPVLCAA